MIVYRASLLGKCVKMQAALRMGYVAMEPPDKMKATFQAGTDTEDEVIADLRSYGWTIDDQQREVVLDVSDEIKIVGHVDGIARVDYGLRDKRLLEIKSMSDGEYEKWLAKRWDVGGLIEHYKWQVSCYMLALNMELMFLVRNRTTGATDLVVQETPFFGLTQVRQRVLEIEAVVKGGVLPVACSERVYPCPVWYLHEDDRETDDALTPLVRSYLGAREAERAAKEHSSQVRSQLQDSMAGRSKVSCEAGKVTLYTTTRKDYDFKAMREDGIDIEKYAKERKVESLRVTPKEENDGQPAAKGTDDKSSS